MSFSKDGNRDPTSENVEQEDKVNVEETSFNLGYVKKELNEEELAFEHKQYKIALTLENVFGESSSEQRRNRDSLIGFLDGDVIMKIETGTVKLEEENKDVIQRNIEQSHCNKCGGNYHGYCVNCSSLSHILNNLTPNFNPEPVLNTTPSNTLEIREVSRGCAVFALKTLPKGIILGPFEGIAPIESTTGLQWKIKNQKFVNDENGNWMKHIQTVANHASKNLDVFQIDGILNFETSREIQEGEELLVCYREEKEEMLELDKEELFYLVPMAKDVYPKVFACTLCCLGFRLKSCLVEHKSKYPHGVNMEDFEIMQCRCCKVWLEKEEYLESHVLHCLDNYNRTWSGYSEDVDRCDADVEEMGEGDCGTRDGKRRYRRDIFSTPYNRTNDLKFDTKDFQCVSGGNQEPRLNECGALLERSNNEQTQNNAIGTNNNHHHKNLNKHKGGGIKPFKCDICMMTFTLKGSLKMHIRNKHTDDRGEKNYKCLDCSYQTNRKSHFQDHLNTHKGIKPFQCDICMMKFTQKCHLNLHIRNKHTDDGDGKDFKCLDCSYQTNNRSNFQRHLNKHKDIIKPFECDICMAKFTEKGSLTKHIKNKHVDNGNAKDYKCSECFYQTNNKTDLQDHLNMHRGIKPFTCDICMKKFCRKGYLKIHVKTKHSVDGSAKDHKCSECFYQTYNKTHFQAHLNKHRGIKPFTCDICMMKFTRKEHLKAHVKNKHTDEGGVKDYKCSECFYQTNRRADLQKHLNVHRGIKPFKCDICMSKFTEKSNLKRHIKKRHTVT